MKSKLALMSLLSIMVGLFIGYQLCRFANFGSFDFDLVILVWGGATLFLAFSISKMILSEDGSVE